MMDKYYKLIDDSNQTINNDNWNRYKKLHLDLIEDYELCLKLFKKKDYIKSIKSLQKQFNMLETGLMNQSLINKINLQYNINVYNKENEINEQETL